MSHKRATEDRKRLRSLADKASTYRIDNAGAYYDKRKKRYVAYTYNDSGLRTISNKIVRRKLKNSDAYLQARGAYKKLYDYKWTII